MTIFSVSTTASIDGRITTQVAKCNILQFEERDSWFCCRPPRLFMLNRQIVNFLDLLATTEASVKIELLK